MENLYQLLEITQDADAKEIKRAYVRMIRKYPPEKEPEMFQKIRKAYERLSDPLSRKEYDALESYGKEIEELCKKGDEALENEDYQVAIRCYKKVLVIEPTLAFAKNYLGIALLYNGQTKEAIIQFEETIELNPDNVTYYVNLGYAYRLNEEYEKAERILKKACALDTIENDAIMELVEVYRAQKKIGKAIESLRKCIALDTTDTDENRIFSYYIKMLEIYIIEQDHLKVNEILEEILKEVGVRIESKDYVVWKLGKFAYNLYEVEAYTFAIPIAEAALKIDTMNEALQELVEKAKILEALTEQYKKLNKDERVIGPLKGPIFYYLYKSQYEDEEKYKEDVEANFNAIQSYLDNEPEPLKKGIEILRNEYVILYKEQQKIYDDIYISACENTETMKQFDKLLDNEYNVANPFKRLIALWLSSDVDDNEREKVFNEILEEIKQLQYSQIQKSINTIRNSYPKLYQLNSETLDEFKAIADKIERQNQPTNISNNTSPSTSTNTSPSTSTNISPSTSTSTYTSPNQSSSTANNTSSNNGGGCLVVLVCAIIGNFIIPGIGFFIGGFIGLKIVE